MISHSVCPSLHLCLSFSLSLPACLLVAIRQLLSLSWFLSVSVCHFFYTLFFVAVVFPSSCSVCQFVSLSFCLAVCPSLSFYLKSLFDCPSFQKKVQDRTWHSPWSYEIVSCLPTAWKLYTTFMIAVNVSRRQDTIKGKQLVPVFGSQVVCPNGEKSMFAP